MHKNAEPSASCCKKLKKCNGRGQIKVADHLAARQTIAITLEKTATAAATMPTV